jgi:hypothetical protein
MRARTFVSTLTLILLAAAPVARAAGVLPPQATPVQREQAQARFQRGRELLDKKQFDQALAEFRASYDIVASPNSHLEYARCLRETGKLVAAYVELGRVAVEARELMAEDKRYEKALDASNAERAELEPKLGFVALTVQNPSDATRLTVGGEEIRRAAWNEPVPVMPGATDILVETPGRGPVRRTVTLAAGQRTPMTIDAAAGGALPAASSTVAPPPSTSEPPADHTRLRPWAYVAGGVGAVGLVVFFVAGSLARSNYNDLQTVCGNNPCPPDKQDEINSGKSKQVVANVGLVFGILGAAAGAALYVWTMPHGAPVSNAAVVVSPGWIGVRGSL